MKPIVLFSSLAVLCAGGLLALSYEGWQDEPSALSSLAGGSESVKVKSADAVSNDQSASAGAEKEPTPSAAEEKPAETGVAALDTTKPEIDGGAVQQPASEVQASTNKNGEQALADAPASFDMVRVEEDGSAVFAGRAASGSKVSILLGESVIGEVTASDRGEWVFVPETALEKGAHQIQLKEVTVTGNVRLSEQTIALTVPEKPGNMPIIVLSETAKPSKVLQQPDASTAQETQVAAARSDQTAAATELEPTATTPETANQSVETGGVTQNADQDVNVKPAPQQPAAEQQAKTTEPVSQPNQQLRVEVVDYDDAGRTLFSGRAAPGSRIRVYVDDAFSGEAKASADGTWALAAGAEIKPGSHALRADQLADSGSVDQRIELPFFRESSSRIASLRAQREQVQGEDQLQALDSDERVASAQTLGIARDSEPDVEILVPSEPKQTATGQAEQPAAEPQPAVTQEPTQEAAVKPEPEQAASAPAQGVAAASEPEQVAAAPAQQEQVDQQAATGKVVIQPGNNLWQISRVIYGKGHQYTVIYEANKDQIRNPDRIYPGQIFETPGSSSPESIDPECKQPLAQCQ